jgi:hypothetical protein
VDLALPAPGSAAAREDDVEEAALGALLEGGARAAAIRVRRHGLGEEGRAALISAAGLARWPTLELRGRPGGPGTAGASFGLPARVPLLPSLPYGGALSATDVLSGHSLALDPGSGQVVVGPPAGAPKRGPSSILLLPTVRAGGRAREGGRGAAEAGGERGGPASRSSCGAAELLGRASLPAQSRMASASSPGPRPASGASGLAQASPRSLSPPERSGPPPPSRLATPSGPHHSAGSAEWGRQAAPGSEAGGEGEGHWVRPDPTLGGEGLGEGPADVGALPQPFATASAAPSRAASPGPGPAAAAAVAAGGVAGWLASSVSFAATSSSHAVRALPGMREGRTARTRGNALGAAAPAQAAP